MAARPEIVHYLRLHLRKHKAETLKSQLAAEGVSDAEFREALLEAGRPQKLTANPLAMGLLGGGIMVLIVSALMLGGRAPAPAPPAADAPAGAGGESAFVGHNSYVVRLPKDYAATQSFKDAKKTQEVVHFSKAGTDPTSLIDEGLYGPLGIVRLDVGPSELAGYTNGLEVLTKHLTAQAQQRGEKFLVKNFAVASLHGVQFTYEVPFARVEAFILGRKTLYSFHAGQEDEVYRDILNSLRETGSEG